MTIRLVHKSVSQGHHWEIRVPLSSITVVPWLACVQTRLPKIRLSHEKNGRQCLCKFCACKQDGLWVMWKWWIGFLGKTLKRGHTVTVVHQFMDRGILTGKCSPSRSDPFMVVKYVVRSSNNLNDDLAIKETTGSYHPITWSSERPLTGGDGSRGLTNIRILIPRSRLIHLREENFFACNFHFTICVFWFSFMGLRVLCILRVKIRVHTENKTIRPSRAVDRWAYLKKRLRLLKKGASSVG